MKRTTTAIILILVVIIAIFALSLASAGTGAVPATDMGAASRQMSAGDYSGQVSIGTDGVETRTINLGYDGHRYMPAEIRVKQGTKVRIIGDPATLTDCMSNVNIDGYVTKKHIQSGDNVIEFTANTPGNFAIHCNMGMGNGRLIVVDTPGNVPAPSAEQAPAKMGGCCCMR
jgi:FtsP/CotA-like multicopper oxidase with cupredoxin domain